VKVRRSRKKREKAAAKAHKELVSRKELVPIEVPSGSERTHMPPSFPTSADNTLSKASPLPAIPPPAPAKASPSYRKNPVSSSPRPLLSSSSGPVDSLPDLRYEAGMGPGCKVCGSE